MAVVIDVDQRRRARDGFDRRRERRHARRIRRRPTEATRPLMDLFEPGSTNKLITLSTAIEDGLVTPDTEIDVPSVLRVGPTPFTDVDPHGDVQMTVTDILRAVVEHRHDQDRATPVEVSARRRAARVRLGHADDGRSSPARPAGPAARPVALLRHRARVDRDRLRRRGHRHADARRVRDDRQRRRDAGRRTCSTRRSTRRACGTRRRSRPGRRVVSAHTARGDDEHARPASSAPEPARARRSPATRSPARPGPRARRWAAATRRARWRRSSGTRPPRTRSSRRSSCSTSPPSTYGGTAAAPVFADVMQFALTHDDVAPDDPANTQYNAARASAAASGTTCTDPAVAAAAARGNCRDRAAAAAAPRRPRRGRPAATAPTVDRADRRAGRPVRPGRPARPGPTGRRCDGPTGRPAGIGRRPTGAAPVPHRRRPVPCPIDTSTERIRRARATARPPR